MKFALYLIFSYLLGSIPTGYILFWISEKKDIRKFGSGNIGFANITRLKGLSFGIPVLILDFFKGFIPVWLGLKISENSIVALTGGFLTCLGHIYPVYLKFKGGKGFATALGVFTGAFFLGALIVSFIAITLIIATGYVSLASIIGVVLYPLVLLIFKKPLTVILIVCLISIMVIYRHKDNIKRLIKGEERKIKRYSKK
ncbi:glycerol-3-phosphate 1-O-acyltransferase PlsY [SCandidatus Aminicenantes bacterium Aminicenantia_JdfR_composite]|jgi:glycerol-3-phosphate acyltransferase PlsY|nr:glycerol-3-phosphate 1-O-acyltransferase PlsY [SCandidatus Aminicenantes bacterium Aminicenantia_JdfR_composite]MCP2597519.1 glycerol-3-phosphate 1-O-acyltransferase PlsY [Candidatus Aminicenantes bacterium AC-335-G13]